MFLVNAHNDPADSEHADAAFLIRSQGQREERGHWNTFHTASTTFYSIEMRFCLIFLLLIPLINIFSHAFIESFSLFHLVL